MGDINNKVAWPNAEEIRAPYYTGIDVPISELMFLSDGSISAVAAGYAAPVLSLTDSGSKTTNQSRLAGAFLGLSHERKVTTDATGTVLIERTAVRQVACNALQTAAKIGDMVAGSVLTATGGTALTSLIVEVTTNAGYAIGYVVEAAALGATSLKVYFVSNKVASSIPGGSQAINTAANLTLTGNLAVNGTTALTGDLTESGNATISGTLKSVGLHSMLAGKLAATGTVIGNAAALVAQFTAVSGVANAGVQLPVIAANTQPPLVVVGDATNAIKVYPAVNCSIDGGAANAAVSLAAAEKRWFVSDGGSAYYSLKGA